MELNISIDNSTYYGCNILSRTPVHNDVMAYQSGKGSCIATT